MRVPPSERACLGTPNPNRSERDMVCEGMYSEKPVDVTRLHGRSGTTIDHQGRTFADLVET